MDWHRGLTEIEKDRAGLKMNPNSATYWLPRLQSDEAIALHVPRSVIVPYDHHAMICAMEGGDEYAQWDSVVQSVRDAARSIGWPVFVRSCLASAKHDGPNSYKASDVSEVARVLSHTAEDNELKFMFEGGPAAFVVRQFLQLEASFVAFHGLPIAREWRFFASHSAIICTHPYWPEDTIRFYRGHKGPRGWKSQLADLHEQPQASEWVMLEALAINAAALCDVAPAWSVDFAKDTGGKWWLIDMAVMERSWHWPDCVNANDKGPLPAPPETEK